MPCCPVLLSLYCIVIVFLNEIGLNGDGDGDNIDCKINSFIQVYLMLKLS